MGPRRLPARSAALLASALLLAGSALAQPGPTADALSRLDALAARLRAADAHPVPYRIDRRTGRLALTEEAQAPLQAPMQARRAALLAELARLPQRERPVRVPRPASLRGNAAVFTVDSAFDEPDTFVGDGVCANLFGECTLRAAIEEAVAQPDAQPVRIEFDIATGPIAPDPGGVWAIPVGFDAGFGAYGSLPFADQPGLTVDAVTQPGASCGNLVGGTVHANKVILDGALASAGNGLDSVTPAFTARGLVVRSFATGIVVAGSGSLVECNQLTGNFGAGAATSSEGTASALTIQNNLLSGNGLDGLDVFQERTQVLRNLVGTTLNGVLRLGNGNDGIRVGADDVLVDGNVVSGNGDFSHGAGYGIAVGADGAGGAADRAVLTNNKVGLSRTGAQGSHGNGLAGIVVEAGARDTEVGRPGAGNFVAASGTDRTGSLGSGNFDGIVVGGTDTRGTRIRGNTVGLDALGTSAPNLAGIIVVLDAPDGATVGGAGASAGNVVSGNREYGVLLGLTGATVVQGNTVGLNSAGNVRANGEGGILVAQTGSVLRGNVVGGNGGPGVELKRATGVVVAGNFIGTDRGGSLDRGNNGAGVLCTANSFEPVFDVRIGGSTAADANTIAFNDGEGVFLNASCHRIALLRNSIRTHGGLGINLCPFSGGCDGVTPNDNDDPDVGANELTNFPTNLTVTNDGTEATISFRLDARPNQRYRVEVFTNAGVDASGYGEGQVFRFATTATTNGNGVRTVTLTKPAAQFPVGQWVTATATPVDGATLTGFKGTSEFSQAAQVAGTEATVAAPEALGAERLPETLALYPAAPNPFSTSARIAFALPEAEHVRLAVYDVLGREVARLVDAEVEAGRHAVSLDGGGLPSGAYLIRLEAGSAAHVQRITLLR